ncbi:hypothetical protein B0H16DRAFT_1254735, partial [Mycena metata]
MTDYASQGKSREENVVDLTNCRDHRAYYVALSRGKSAKGTIILQNFDDKKITSGMSGYLRQELRELETLDEITRLRHEGLLPSSVTGMYRRRLIRSYLLWKGRDKDQSSFHPALRCTDPMGPSIPEELVYSQWVSSTGRPQKRKGVSGDGKGEGKARKKQKATSHSAASDVADLGTTGLDDSIPVGLIWDGTDYSCGYDAMLTILRNIWMEDILLWS